jgi:methionyl-tRNA formyltransferase
MPKVVVLGTYDMEPAALSQIDLIAYLRAVGCAPAGLVYRTQRPNPPAALLEPLTVDGALTTVRVPNFTEAAAIGAVAGLQPDLLIYAGGRDILPAPLLESAPLGCLGSHYGQLPEIRGMGTVEWSVIEGLPIVVTVQRLTPAVDMGDVLMSAEVALSRDDTYAVIRERCYFVAKSLLALSARGLLLGALTPAPQPAGQGRQYFRMHPALHQLAEGRLARRLAAYRPVLY